MEGIEDRPGLRRVGRTTGAWGLLILGPVVSALVALSDRAWDLPGIVEAAIWLVGGVVACSSVLIAIFLLMYPQVAGTGRRLAVAATLYTTVGGVLALSWLSSLPLLLVVAGWPFLSVVLTPCSAGIELWACPVA